MHDRHGVAEPAAEAPHRLRGQRDLGHEHAGRAALREHPLDGLQIHLGFTGAGDAVDKHHAAIGGVAGDGDGLERLRLAAGELRFRRRGVRGVFVAGRRIGIAAARLPRTAFASRRKARGSPFDGNPVSGAVEASGIPANGIPARTRDRALRDARRAFGEPTHTAAMLYDHRAFRLQGLKR